MSLLQCIFDIFTTKATGALYFRTKCPICYSGKCYMKKYIVNSNIGQAKND